MRTANVLADEPPVNSIRVVTPEAGLKVTVFEALCPGYPPIITPVSVYDAAVKRNVTGADTPRDFNAATAALRLG
jgi:hypothetical protein